MSPRLIYCAQHLRCVNKECLRKPTAKEIKQMIGTPFEINWIDYHLPECGVNCYNHKGDNYHG